VKRYYLAALVAVVFVLYAKSLFFDYTYLDDAKLILKDQKFLSDFSNLPDAFKRDVLSGREGPGVFYRPLVTVSLMLDAHIGKAGPFVYHATNVMLHALVTCLVFIVLAALEYPALPSFLLSLVFAVHPVQTQAVAWIPGRTEMLLAVFSLSAFLCLTRFCESGRAKYLFAHLFFFACALLSKESALAVIPVSLFYLYAVRKKKLFSEQVVVLAFCWSVTGLAWYFARDSFLPYQIQLTSQNMALGLVHNISGMILYLGKLFLPLNMSVLSVRQDMPFVYGEAALAAMVIIFAAARPKSVSRVLFGLVWAVFFLAPTFINPNPAMPSHFMEDRLYLALAGILIMFMEIDLIRNMRSWRDPAMSAGAGLILLLLCQTFQYSDFYKNRKTFWENAVMTSPHSYVAHYNLGNIYLDERSLDAAEAQFTAAIMLEPGKAIGYNALGLVYIEEGLFARAEAGFRKTLALDPGNKTAETNLDYLDFKMKKGH